MIDKIKSIIPKIKKFLYLILYAGIIYGFYLVYLEYQKGGLDQMLDWAMSLPVEVLGIAALFGAVLLAEMAGGEQ